MTRRHASSFHALAASVILAAALAACHRLSPEEDAQRKINTCAAQAAEYLDPHWRPRQVTGAYPAADGVDVTIRAQGVAVSVSCGVGSADYTHFVTGVAKIQGVEPAPGQLYLPMKGRWLTAEELHAKLAALLSPRLGEYAGQPWAPNPPGVYTISDLAGVPSTACFLAQSRLDPARQLVACEVAGGHRFWVSQGQLSLELKAPPIALAPIPRAPPADLATQPGGVPH